MLKREYNGEWIICELTDRVFMTYIRSGKTKIGTNYYGTIKYLNSLGGQILPMLQI